MHQRTLLLITADEPGWAELRALLRPLTDLRVAGETPYAGQALRLAAKLNPDLLLTAATVEGAPVLPLLRGLLGNGYPARRIAVCAPRFAPDDLLAFADLGIGGYLLWSDLCPATLRQCLDALLADQSCVSGRAVATAFLEGWRSHAQPQEPVRLTPRERAILRRLSEGLSEEQIARAEGLSPRAVRRAVAGLEAKMATSPCVGQ